MKKHEAHAVSRRSFVTASAAALASLSLVGCQPETKVEKTDAAAIGEAASYVSPDVDLDPNSGGEWIPIVCNANCGGFCENKVFVQDGVVIRQKTDDTTAAHFRAKWIRVRPGTDNVLTAPVGSGCGTAGYNTNLVNFGKYDGEQPADYELDPRTPAGIEEE